MKTYDFLFKSGQLFILPMGASVLFFEYSPPQKNIYMYLKKKSIQFERV